MSLGARESSLHFLSLLLFLAILHGRVKVNSQPGRGATRKRCVKMIGFSDINNCLWLKVASVISLFSFFSRKATWAITISIATGWKSAVSEKDRTLSSVRHFNNPLMGERVRRAVMRVLLNLRIMRQKSTSHNFILFSIIHSTSFLLTWEVECVCLCREMKRKLMSHVTSPGGAGCWRLWWARNFNDALFMHTQTDKMGASSVCMWKWTTFAISNDA